MARSLKEFKSSYLELINNFLWRQWSALGVAGYAESRDNWFIDPEALLLFTCSLGRYDARLFDEMLDWLDVNGTLINIQRLRNIQKKEQFNSEKVLKAIASIMSKRSKYFKWKTLALLNREELINKEENLFLTKEGNTIESFGTPDKDFQEYGLIRGKIEFRGHTQPVRILQNTGLLIKLRALLGVNTRCEIILHLLTHNSAHPALIAKETYYAQKTIQDLLVEMSHSGLINISLVGKEKHYWLDRVKWFDFLKIQNDSLRWVKWPEMFKALEETWLKINDDKLLNYDSLLLSSELRVLMQKIKPKIESAGFLGTLSDEKLFFGENYTEVFYNDLKKLFE
ncbi:MAG: hypothetical protein KKH91_00740 [Elusimicrobia bacterium]|nr:hypothetical protein [Elusimicrobiota bacterium]MBU2614186.1 hypothetical protein [Elusimicrobiota bacterium]